MQPSDSNSTHVLVHDAGLVLLNPFLPHLFERTHVLAEGRIAAGNEGRAGALLSYAVSGMATRERLSPLVLILCGLAPTAEVEAELLAPEDVRIAESMLAAMRQQWSIVHDSSIVALRGTFLQREGRLHIEATERFQLHVMRKTVDVLVDRLPWSFALIKHVWMPQALQVSW